MRHPGHTIGHAAGSYSFSLFFLFFSLLFLSLTRPSRDVFHLGLIEEMDYAGGRLDVETVALELLHVRREETLQRRGPSA